MSTASPWKDYGYDRNHFALTRTVEPSAQPVEITEAMNYLKTDEYDDATLITSLIIAATTHAESFTQRSFITQTWRYRQDVLPFGGMIVLPRPNLISVSSFTYVDTAGATQTLASDQYIIDSDSQPGSVSEAYGVSWPAMREQPGAIAITYTAGYGAASAVPSGIKQAILFLVAHWYEQRQPVATGTIVNEVPDTWKALLAPFCVGWEQ